MTIRQPTLRGTVPTPGAMRRTPCELSPGSSTRDGPEAARREAERTERAPSTWRPIAERLDGYLVLHDAVDIALRFEARHLPAGAVDARDGDPLGLAVADPAAVGRQRGRHLHRHADRQPILGGRSRRPRSHSGAPRHRARLCRHLHGLPSPRSVRREVTSTGSPSRSSAWLPGSSIGGRARARRRANDHRVPLGAASITRSTARASPASSGRSPGIPARMTSEAPRRQRGSAKPSSPEADRLPPESLTLNGRRWR